MKLTQLHALCSIAVLTMVVAGCDHPPTTPPPPRPALVMIVGGKAATPTMTLVGEILPRYESIQGFRIGGKIIERKVEVGMRVSKSQVLARLDPVDTELTASATQADMKSAEANLALAKAELTRYRELATKNFVSASALDIKETDYKTAQAKLAQLQAQANVSINQTHYTLLTADRDGIISMIRAEPGQVVSAGESIAKIADTQHIDVLVAVPESRMAEVKINQTVRLRSWANRKQIYQGVVREISPIAESATRTFNVWVTIQNPDIALKFGMTVGVSFHNESKLSPSGVIIPNAALTEANGKKIVWVIDANNTAQAREVQIGEFSETGVEIINGLAAGEKIAIAGVHTVIKGQLVKPIIAASP